MSRLLSAALAAGIVFGAWAGDRPEGLSLATRSVVLGRRGMVASAHPLATAIGVDILKRGGSAVDAAIAVNAALSLMEPVSCGPGGDLFALVWDPGEGKLAGYNGSGRAPLALKPEMIPAQADGTIPLHSPWAWTVPGAVDGWFALHARFGKLPMKELLAPAIAYAREGVAVPQVIAASWQRGARVFGDKPGFAQVFLPGGKAPREGDLFQNPALARTFETLAAEGRDAFYKGSLARALAAFAAQVGGPLSAEDLARHAGEWVEPIATTYRGYTVHEIPPNGQGLAALQLLSILETFDLRRMGRDSADFWHTMVEAKKLAFADRARFYADPAFAEIPLQHLLSKTYAAERAKLIDPARAARTVEPGTSRLAAGDTTFLCAADERGMMVALIQSNYTGFGSGYAVPELGFGIQNRGAQFSLQPGHPNRLAPGKRPFHTIIPAFLSREGKPLLAFGVMGGDMQPQGHAQVVVNLIDFGMNLQEAGDAPRFYHTGSAEPTGTGMADGGVLHLESGIGSDVRRELLKRGHRLVEANGIVFGGYQAVWRDPRTLVYFGASESRKDGCALGY